MGGETGRILNVNNYVVLKVIKCHLSQQLYD